MIACIHNQIHYSESNTLNGTLWNGEQTAARIHFDLRLVMFKKRNYVSPYTSFVGELSFWRFLSDDDDDDLCMTN